ncbi:MAG: hypothetical protein KGL10_04640 [Alphaproteobacteria bacterium]|nr:hypothetical protein [Alphaproteobacteria bacterium]
MTEAFKLPREVETAYREIPQKALTVLAALADGNGLRADQVRLLKGETDIHLIPAAITITLAPEIAKSQINGQNPRGEVLSSEAEVLAAAAALMPVFLQGETTRQEIFEPVRRGAGEGFGMAETTLAVKSAAKTFSVISSCPQCGGEGSVSCAPCRGTGRVPCQNCRGQGFTACFACRGAGMVPDGAGGSTPCQTCQRSGKTVCPACNGGRESACQACSGQGRTACAACGQSGAQTVVYGISVKALCRFEIDWRKVPAEVKALAEKLGGEKAAKLVARKHAEVYWQVPELREKDLVVDGVACFPVAAVDFSVAGKAVPATVAGLQGRICEMEPVLDPFVKPGIAALTKLSKGPLAAAALVATACKYKLARRALAEVAARPKKAVYQALARDYAPALSDKYARAAVGAAARALSALGNGPRTQGLCLGAVLAVALAAGYYMTPLRLRLFTALAEKGMERYITLVDAGEGLLGVFAALFLIRLMAGTALRKMLPPSVLAEATGGLDTFRPGVGKQGLLVLPAVAAVTVAVAALAAHKPEWVLFLLRG